MSKAKKATKAKKQEITDPDDFVLRAGGGGGEILDDAPLNFADDTKQELNELQQAFKNAADRENTRFWDAVDSEFWFAICFQTREQKEEFLQALKLLDLGDKYLDGMKVAKRLQITLKSRVPHIAKLKESDKSLEELAMDL